MVAPFEGGCLCGAVRYRVDAEPIAFVFCHCRDCQYVSGGQSAAVVIVPKPTLHVTKGDLSGFTVQGTSGQGVTRKFCPTCGTPLFSEVEANPAVMVIKAGSLDDPSWLKPMVTVWAGSAQPWAHIDPALPRFEANPPG